MESIRKDTVKSREELLEYLIEEYSQAVKRLAFTYVNSWSAADDITQDVFILCFKNLKDFRGDSSYKTWIYKITVNRCKDYLKSKWFRSILPTDRISLFSKEKSPAVDEHLAAKDEERALSEKVLSLPPKYREVIVLFYYEDFSVKEIEILTGIKQETVKTRLRRAKEMLRISLEGVSE